jgi:hypothetical protein
MPLGPIVARDDRRGKNKMACLWRGYWVGREEHFMHEMVLRVEQVGEGGHERSDVHFFLDFRLKEPYI